ncbi:MAG TPA: hypothetical protein GX526_03575 [Thermoanaerobacterales bacterium]|nr:hypothetical protein [Thermoanaerobacterales bacterium]
MEIAFFDNLAVNGKSFLHNSSTLSKFVLTIIIIFCIVVAKDISKLIFIIILELILIIILKLPMKKILPIIFSPMFFSVVFAFTKYRAFGYGSFLVLSKTFSAVLCMTVLISVTPFTKLFSMLSFFLPRIISDALFITYRSIFILLEQFSNHLILMRIRGGFSGSFAKRIRNLSSAIGLAIIHSIDLSERMYQILKIRGYKGKIFSDSSFFVFKREDIISYILALGNLLVVIL